MVKQRKGFALITVLIISTILFGVIGFTFISANRNLNLKTILHLSKTSLTTADAGLEEIIREIQSEHFNNIGLYFLNLYNTGLDTTPALFSYYPEFFKDPRNGNYIQTRAKYFLDFDYYTLDDEGIPVPMKIVNWEDINSNGLADEGEYLSKVVTEPNEIKVRESVIEYIRNLVRPQDDSKIDAICNDIQSAYNQWMNYLWGLNWNEGFKTTDTGANLGVMEEMISRIGGNDLVSDCSGIDINDVVKPYDVDHPATGDTYEGIIIQTAGKIDTSEQSPSRGLIIITAIGYSFSSPIPKDDYANIIKPRLALVCPRPSDPEFSTHYLNVLDIDTINNSLKLAGSRYRITPMKRGIRGEFEVKFESPLNSIIQLLRQPDSVTTVTYQDQVSFSDYLVASNDTIYFGYDEEVHGPIRSNGNINFSGEIWDTITAKGYVRDYITFGPYAYQHTGGFHFYLNGVEYKVEPFKNSSQNNPISTVANIYPPLVYNGNTYNTVNIVQSPDQKTYYVDLPPFNSPLNNIGSEDVKVYSQQQPNMDFSKVQTSENQIKTIAQNTGYYFNGSSKAVELHFLENGTIQVKEGNGPTRIIPMPTNYPVTLPNGTIYTGGVIYVNGDVTVRGKVNGRVTVYASDDVWIESDLTYVHPPVTDPNQTPNYIPDSLGLIAYDDVIIDKNAPEHLRIDAAVLAQNGSFGIDPNANYHPYNPNGHVLDFRGSQTFYSADNAPAIISGNKVKGYETQLTYYDYNLRRARPPLFPSIGDEVVTRIAITNTQTYDEKNLVGPLKSTLFGRILWREMVNPP
ncbi:MAG: hypothetical protein ACP5IV_04785 [Caldisericia bacterium]